MDLDFNYDAPAIGYLWDGMGYLPLHLASGSLTSGPYFVDLSTSATPPDAYAGLAPEVVERDEDRIASIDAATGVLTVTGPDFVVDVFNGGTEIALQAQTAVGADGTLYVASVIEDPGTDTLNEGRTLAVLTWGDPTDWAATRQQYVVPYKSSTYYPSGGVYPDLEEPTGLAVGVSEDVISLVLSTNPIPSAIAGTTGNVYWMTVTL